MPEIVKLLLWIIEFLEFSNVSVAPASTVSLFRVKLILLNVTVPLLPIIISAVVVRVISVHVIVLLIIQSPDSGGAQPKESIVISLISDWFVYPPAVQFTHHS